MHLRLVTRRFESPSAKRRPGHVRLGRRMIAVTGSAKGTRPLWHLAEGEDQDEDCKVFQVQVFHGDFLHFWHFAMVFSGGGWRSRCQRPNLEYKKTAPYPTMGQELYSCDTTQIDAFASARSCAASCASRWITGGHPSVPTCIHTNAFRPPSKVHSPYAVPLHSHHRQLSEGPVLQGYSSFSKVSLVFSCWRHYSRTSRTSQLSI